LSQEDRKDRTPTGLNGFASRTVACARRLDEELSTRCGVAPQCDCTEHNDCTLPVGAFHPFADFLGTSRLTLDAMAAAPLLCELRDLDFGRYSECDDGSIRYHLSEGTENEYRFVFNRLDGRLDYGHADGYVAQLCGLGDLDGASISTGPAPADASCRTCEFCDSAMDGGAGGAEGALPECSFQQGHIGLPRP
jgi:hypothetical protein